MGFIRNIFKGKEETKPTAGLSEVNKEEIQKIISELRNEYNSVDNRVNAAKKIGKINNFGDIDIVNELSAAAKNAALKYEVGKMTLAMTQGCRPDQIKFMPHADHSRVTNTVINILSQFAKRKDIGDDSKKAINEINNAIKGGISQLTGYGSND